MKTPRVAFCILILQWNAVFNLKWNRALALEVSCQCKKFLSCLTSSSSPRPFFPFFVESLSSLQQRLQFSDIPTASLPRQQHKSTPHRHPSDQSECFSTPMAVFPWERDDSRSAARRRSPTSPQTPVVDFSQAHSEQGVCGKEKDLVTQTDSEWSQMVILETRLTVA